MILRSRRVAFAALIASAMLGSLLFGAVAGRAASRELPSVRGLEDYRPPSVSQVFAGDGTVLTTFGADKRILLRYAEIPEAFVDAVVATEDSRFYEHFGVDIFGVARAVAANLRSFRFGAEGASTISMQLARNLFLKPDKTMKRKIQETFLALEIERTYSKEEILGFYCNQIYMGPRRYGIEAAAQYYFGKPASEITLSEAALLAGVIQNASLHSPFRSLERARARRAHVLRRMVEEKMITPAEADAAKQEPIELAEGRRDEPIGSYFVEGVRRQLMSRYGEQALYQGGLRVQTTLDPALQQAATEALRTGLVELQSRRGWVGVFASMLDGEKPSDGLLEDYEDPSWEDPLEEGREVRALVMRAGRAEAVLRIGDQTRSIRPAAIEWSAQENPSKVFRPGDLVPVRIGPPGDDGLVAWRLEPAPEVEGAVVVIEPATGEIKALVGGYDFQRSSFDRSRQALRQPGSAFKPFVMSAAIAGGATPTLLIRDEPTVFVYRGSPEPYQPRNYSLRYGGLVTMRDTLEESRNIASVRLLGRIGARPVIDLARSMGIDSRMSPFPSLALGSFEVSPLELTGAYAVYPNQGIWVEPHMIRSVRDAEGRLAQEAQPAHREAMSPTTAYLVTHMMRGVIERGTATGARILGRDLAGKTGTTNDYTDAWFMGFSPSLVCGVWVGLDRKESLGEGETGSKAALPIWIDFMARALATRQPEEFPRPSGVVFVPVDRRTGLRSTFESACSPADIILEAFAEGTEVLEVCTPADHFRVSLPYFLQRFQVTEDLALLPDVRELALLLQTDRSSLRLSPDGRELEVLHQGRPMTLRLALDEDRIWELSRLAAMPPPDPPEGGPWFGSDGRPADVLTFRP